MRNELEIIEMQKMTGFVHISSKIFKCKTVLMCTELTKLNREHMNMIVKRME